MVKPTDGPGGTGDTGGSDADEGGARGSAGRGSAGRGSAGRGGVGGATSRLHGPAGLLIVAVLLAVAVVAPDPTPVGAARLGSLVVAVAGASVLVVRAGAADLATAAGMAAGAYLGGVATALLAWPVVVGVPLGAAAGAVVGAASAVLHVRVGRALGALTSLALGGGTVAALGAWPAGGGAGGFHAVPLLSRAGVRVELAVVAVVVVLGLALAWRATTSRLAAAAAVAVRSPVVAASLGRRPIRDAAGIGAVAGALLGAGGTVLAAVDGSVVPAGYGLQLAAAIALAALLGGTPPLGPVAGMLVVWGPGTIWPLVPLVGTGPPLLVMGPLGLALLALRRGQPLLPAGTGPPPVVDGPPAPRPPAREVAIAVQGAATPSGPCHLAARPGEVVALAGPNGAGKSTLLARMAGQLPDGGTVLLGDRRAPHGAVARAGAGIRRTWQRAPAVAAADLVRLIAADPAAAAAAAWARQVLDADHASGTGVQQLVQLAASGPAVALLDEPTDVDAERLAVLLRGLASAGTAVVVVDHRPEVLTAADRVVRLGVEEVAR